MYSCLLNSHQFLLIIVGADIAGLMDCDTFYPFFGSYNMVEWLAKTLDMLLDSANMQDTGSVVNHSCFSVYIIVLFI